MIAPNQNYWYDNLAKINPNLAEAVTGLAKGYSLNYTLVLAVIIAIAFLILFK
jgi:hypothetical protein